MKLLSINVGLPRDVDWRGRKVRTSIFKTPVSGPVRVRTLNLEGDEQSDLSVHGGTDKAVYAYPSEHYAYWQSIHPGADLRWGAFGENFTTAGLSEDRVCIGDVLRCGTAELVVTQPRLPCFKLGLRFDRPEIVGEFLRSGRTGFYLAVVREGTVAAGDPIELTASAGDRLSVAEIARLYVAEADDAPLLQRASELLCLPAGWRERFRARLREMDARRGATPRDGLERSREST